MKHANRPTQANLPPITETAALDNDQLLARLGAHRDGLSVHEVAARRRVHGLNSVAQDKTAHPLRRLAEMFANPLSLMLLGLAIVSELSGEAVGAAVIILMVVLSVLLTFFQEYRSSRAAEKLRSMVHTTATVLRRGRPGHADPDWVEEPLARVVPGDIVRLSAGDLVPADCRLLVSKDLFVNQAALTGESMPAEKHAGGETVARAIPDLPNMVLLGAHVLSGTATAVVAATGRASHLGGIAQSITGGREASSFDAGVNRFALLMLRFMLVMVPLVFLVNGLSKGDWVQALLFAVAVAVGLTPEMLPMVVTINLAKGALAMARKKAIVKRLAAIQNFGAMDVLCTDKTGTLTQDRVILERHIDIAGGDSRHVLELAYLNSHYQSGLKNLLDVAILEHAEMQAHLQIATRFSKVDEIPFDFQRRRMSVVVEEDRATHLLICKGAVDEIFQACSHGEIGDERLPLDESHYPGLAQYVAGLNDEGFRVIAVACKTIPAGHSVYSVADESDLTLVGFVAFLDPPKDSAREALLALRQSGVAVKVLTGDNEAVTRKVCAQVGLEAGRIVPGTEVAAASDEQLAGLASSTSVFAKLTPEQKARVIRALRANGHVVGYLGDGINDGPALQAADVGISVDTAVDIAKESADIILLEKNLLVLQQGVIEGRRVFGNIVKYIRMGASSNFGNMLSVIGASAFLPFLPMAPVQILLNNLLYDFSQAALATDNVDAEYLNAPRRWDIGNVGRYMLAIGPISSLFDYATYAVMLTAFHAWEQPDLFQTGWFVESLLSQTLIVHVIRTGRIPLLQSRASTALTITTISVCAIGMALPYSPFAAALGMTALPPAYWAALALILAAYLTLTQLAKSWLTRRFGLD